MLSRDQAEILEKISNLFSKGLKQVLISAYPGFGKTRLIPYIADILFRQVGIDKVLIFCRSIAEVEEICKFFKEHEVQVRVSSLVGRERLCPFKARTALECAQLRDRGICPLFRSRAQGSFNYHVLNVDDVLLLSREFNTCPYDLSLSLAMQSDIVICTMMYLSNRSLYETILKIMNDKNIGVIVDEAHVVVQGLESYVETSTDISTILGIELENREHIIVKNPRIDIDQIKKRIRPNDENLISILFSDVIYISKRDDRYIIRSLTLSTLLDLIKRAKRVVFLSASLTREFAERFPILRSFSKIFLYRPPKYVENLKIFIVPDFELRESFKYTRRCVDFILSTVRSIIPNLPLVGGIMLLFSSKKFMNFVIDDLVNLLESIDIKYMVYTESESSNDIIDKFKKYSSEDRCILITYTGSPVCEGVNFIGDELISILMFGFPFPEFSYWNNWKFSYMFRNNYFFLGFVYTAISTTIQAIGRCMRDLDTRVKYVFLIDRRFMKYRRYFPSWFPRIRVVRLREIGESFCYL